MKKIALIILFIGFGLESYACECSKLLWAEWNKNDIKLSIKNSDLIFLGELISSTSESYQFKVITVFKGDIIKGEIIEGFYTSTCSGRPHPSRTGKWIFYGYFEEFENQNLLTYSTCGPTRSLNYPVVFTKEQNENYWEQELELLNTKK